MSVCKGVLTPETTESIGRLQSQLHHRVEDHLHSSYGSLVACCDQNFVMFAKVVVKVVIIALSNCLIHSRCKLLCKMPNRSKLSGFPSTRIFLFLRIFFFFSFLHNFFNIQYNFFPFPFFFESRSLLTVASTYILRGSLNRSVGEFGIILISVLVLSSPKRKNKILAVSFTSPAFYRFHWYKIHER